MFYGWKNSHSDFMMLNPHSRHRARNETVLLCTVRFGFTLRSSLNDALNQNILWISIPFRLAQIFILRQTINANELETSTSHPTTVRADDGVDIV